MASLLERVQEVVADKLSVDPEEVTPDASFTEDLNADSLDLVELIMAFEEEFGDDDNPLEISDEDAESITTVQAALRLPLRARRQRVARLPHNFGSLVEAPSPPYQVRGRLQPSPVKGEGICVPQFDCDIQMGTDSLRFPALTKQHSSHGRAGCGLPVVVAGGSLREQLIETPVSLEAGMEMGHHLRTGFLPGLVIKVLPRSLRSLR